MGLKLVIGFELVNQPYSPTAGPVEGVELMTIIQMGLKLGNWIKVRCSLDLISMLMS